MTGEFCRTAGHFFEISAIASEKRKNEYISQHSAACLNSLQESSFMYGFADSVSFSISPNIHDHSSGIYQISGLMTYNERKLGLEYKINSSMITSVHPTHLGTTSADKLAESAEIIRHQFELGGIRDFEFNSNLFACRVSIIANSLDFFEQVHGALNEKLVLQIGRKERRNAQSFISIIKADLSELKLNRLSGE
ncbi:MAG: hypothetical protein AB8G77_00085 [Rhodothermales bacterium]